MCSGRKNALVLTLPSAACLNTTPGNDSFLGGVYTALLNALGLMQGFTLMQNFKQEVEEISRLPSEKTVRRTTELTLQSCIQ